MEKIDKICCGKHSPYIARDISSHGLSPTFYRCYDACTSSPLQHLLTTQTTFPVNHPVWISRMEERGVTKESDREAVAL